MFKSLSYSNALSGGSSLWIIQSLTNSSPLSLELDWHLQFVVRKTSKPKNDPLLIESSLYLPCNHVCFIPFNKNHSTHWITQAQNSWSDLNKPSLKIFLPSTISKEDLIKNWPYESLPYKIKLIMDQ